MRQVSGFNLVVHDGDLGIALSGDNRFISLAGLDRIKKRVDSDIAAQLTDESSDSFADESDDRSDELP